MCDKNVWYLPKNENYLISWSQKLLKQPRESFLTLPKLYEPNLKTFPEHQETTIQGY